MFKRQRSTSNKISSGIGLKDSLEINASAELVWRLLLDIPSYPKLFRNTVSIEALPVRPKKCLSPVVAGAKFLEKRCMEGNQNFVFPVSVTAVEEKKETTRRKYSLASASRVYFSTGTSTFTVERLGSGRCRLLNTYGLVPDGWRGKLYLWMFQARITRTGERIVLADMSDIRQAAESGKYYQGDAIL